MTSIIDRARALRPIIETLATNLDDETALAAVELFVAWDGDGHAYEVDDRVRYDGVLYRCLQAHTSQAGWAPDVAPSLWARVVIPDPEVIPDWVQPTGSTDAYMQGDKVKHNAKTWTSDIDYNVYEPGVACWTEASE